MIGSSVQAKSIKILTLCLMMIFASGCATRYTIAVDGCDLFAPISFSVDGDTIETLREIEKHNTKYEEFCNE